MSPRRPTPSEGSLPPVPPPAVVLGHVLSAAPHATCGDGVSLRALAPDVLASLSPEACSEERPELRGVHGLLIDVGIDSPQLAALLTRFASREATQTRPILLCGVPSAPLADLLTLAQLPLHARDPSAASSLDVAFAHLAWRARHYVRRHPEHRLTWARDTLAPWIAFSFRPHRFTDQQLHALALSTLGLTQEATAARLHVSIGRVEVLLKAAREPFGTTRLDELVSPLRQRVAAEVASGGTRPQPP